MDELLQEFLTETNESIALLDVELVNLEQNPDNPGLIDNIFRLVHTIKGTCGFLGLPRLEKVAHASENVLGKVRDGELAVSPAAVSLVLASIDQIKSLLNSLEMTEKEPPGDDSALIGKLNHLAETGEVPGAAAAPAAGAADAAAEEAPAKPAKAAKKPAAKKPAAKAKKAAAEAEPAEEAEEPAGGDLAKFDPELGRELLPGEVSLAELDAIFEATEAAPETAPPPAAAPVAAKTGQVEEGQERGESAIANQSIRVNVNLLENLMTMVSELVLTRNQLLQMVRGQEGSAFTVPLQRLSHCTSELQENVMKTRMQPIGNAWAKLPRIVRDLGMELGKKIQLDMHGQDTELDRQVLDLIKDPLTHMVRNSADHGLEMPDARRAAGKSETGHVRLNAFHEGGHIIITVADDGKGLSTEGIRRKAIEKGLVSEAEAVSLTQAQIQQFIFKPGFSTAASVTSVSGRGVGMDVVRTNIEKIGGTIELRSEEGRGTTFTIKIPLTLAIVSALIVECAGERYAIPQLSVVELVRTASNSEMRIEQIQDTPVLRLRNRLLPLVFLSKVLDLAAAVEKREAFVVVVQVGSAQFGIVVDGVFDTEEIVVKPVAPVLRDISVFGGNTILGDGSVIMILDVNGIASLLEDMQMEEKLAEEEEERHRATTDESTSLLLFRAGGAEPKAVPLGLVARLEELPVESIEHVDGRDMVQYRGALMPLLRMRHDVAVRDSGRQPVLVFADGERTMGLMVDEILDIVEAGLKVEMASEIDGIVGTAVIAGKATELLDLGYYLQLAFGDWFNTRREKAFGTQEATRRILLVDDSPFFRNMLTPILGAAGYNVTAVGSADEALALRNKGLTFDIIVSDIEMPGMNGFDFAAEVRRSPDWQSVPLIALSSHATQHDFEQGRTVGFSDYIAKFDRDALLSVLSHTLGEAA
ncbi:chemotaxis protein CheW [Marinibaculum pumilum]|uniref:histidine kinase n=1 Tax=Marinibaculum pumilum TaxID=1766165 RepID=A0ABV7KZE8_9PROT